MRNIHCITIFWLIIHFVSDVQSTANKAMITSIINVMNSNFLLFFESNDFSWTSASSASSSRLMMMSANSLITQCVNKELKMNDKKENDINRHNVDRVRNRPYEIGSLWNETSIVGLSRIDASVAFRNIYSRHVLALFVQLIPSRADADRDLLFTVININLRRMVGFGSGELLFGGAWRKTDHCLTRIVDIVGDAGLGVNNQTADGVGYRKLEHLTHYIVCRESSIVRTRTSSRTLPFRIYRALFDVTMFRYLQLQQLSERNVRYFLGLPPPTSPITDELFRHFRRVASLSTANISAIVDDDDDLVAIDRWSMLNNSFLLAKRKWLQIQDRNQNIDCRFEIAQLFDDQVSKMANIFIIESTKSDQSIWRKEQNSNKMIQSKAFQAAQILTFIICFAFVYAFFCLLRIGVANLADAIHEGVLGQLSRRWWWIFGSRHAKNPIWLSEFELNVY